MVLPPFFVFLYKNPKFILLSRFNLIILEVITSK